MIPADAVDALIRAAHHVGRGDGEISAVIEARDVVLTLLARPRNDPHRDAAIALCIEMEEWRGRGGTDMPPIWPAAMVSVRHLASEALRHVAPAHDQNGRPIGVLNASAESWCRAAKLIEGGWTP